jgi:hypothetical protein
MHVEICRNLTAPIWFPEPTMAETLAPTRVRYETPDGLPTLAPNVREILQHLCTGSESCRSIATVTEWCDAEDDRDHFVICPGCGTRFAVTEGDLGELRRWTDRQRSAIACGVRWE